MAFSCSLPCASLGLALGTLVTGLLLLVLKSQYEGVRGAARQQRTGRGAGKQGPLDLVTIAKALDPEVGGGAGRGLPRGEIGRAHV